MEGESYMATALLLALSAAGIAAIWFASERIEPLQTTVAGISEAGLDSPLVGRLVSVDATVCNVRKSKSGSLYWSVADDDDCATVLTAPVFEKTLKAMGVAKGDVLRITGTVDEYEGELEIVPKDAQLLGGGAGD
jgi:DNA/RNA endonuclease YhcR with UshA esterase domain